jgi:hypothetical protein
MESKNLFGYNLPYASVALQTARDDFSTTEIKKLLDQQDGLGLEMREISHILEEMKNIEKDLKENESFSLERDYRDTIDRFNHFHFPNHQNNNPNLVQDDDNPFGSYNLDKVDRTLLKEIIHKCEAMLDLDRHNLTQNAHNLSTLTNVTITITDILARHGIKQTDSDVMIRNFRPAGG